MGYIEINYCGMLKEISALIAFKNVKRDKKFLAKTKSEDDVNQIRQVLLNNDVIGCCLMK